MNYSLDNVILFFSIRLEGMQRPRIEESYLLLIEMNKYLLLAVSCYFYLISSFSNPKCRGKRYRCGEFNKPNVCVNVSEFTNKEHLLFPCPLGKHCPISKEVNFESPLECVDNEPAKLLLPGELCTTATECLSGDCNKGICMGTSNCQSHENCDPGYFCDGG